MMQPCRISPQCESCNKTAPLRVIWRRSRIHALSETMKLTNIFVTKCVRLWYLQSMNNGIIAVSCKSIDICVIRRRWDEMSQIILYLVLFIILHWVAYKHMITNCGRTNVVLRKRIIYLALPVNKCVFSSLSYWFYVITTQKMWSWWIQIIVGNHSNHGVEILFSWRPLKYRS